MSPLEGYLVVLEKPEDLQGSLNSHYRGMFCIPAYNIREHGGNLPEEEKALDAYVFGNYKNESGFIQTLEKARQLLALFARSPRKFNIIYCQGVGTSAANQFEVPSVTAWKLLGFDVVSLGGTFWSIVADFDPSLGEFLKELNDSGLFKTAEDAKKFLERYSALKLPHYDDTDFEILEVRLVE